MEFEKKCFGLKTPNISSNATCQTDGNRLQACLNQNVKQIKKKTHFGFDSHFSERSWHKSSVCIKIASCYTLQKEKSILHRHIKHEASSNLAYSHTQHITHAIQILQKHLQPAWHKQKPKQFISHVLPEDKPHALWIQTYAALFAEPHQSSSTIYTSKVCRVEGNHRALITSERNPKSSVHMHTHKNP